MIIVDARGLPISVDCAPRSRGPRYRHQRSDVESWQRKIQHRSRCCNLSNGRVTYSRDRHGVTGEVATVLDGRYLKLERPTERHCAIERLNRIKVDVQQCPLPGWRG